MQSCAERREKPWKRGVQVHGVLFRETDTESAGLMNSVLRCAKNEIRSRMRRLLELVLKPTLDHLMHIRKKGPQAPFSVA
jgi:adenylyl- and sulfurtransferase ThiI